MTITAPQPVQRRGRAKCRPKRTTLFLPYQQAWIEDRSRLKLMEKSRQIGISWSTAYAAVRRMAEQGARLDQWVSSRDDMQARLFIEDCKHFASVLNLAAKDLGLAVIDEANGRDSSYQLRFATGTRIHSMSSNPDAQAGKRGGRILDEFALHPNPRKLWAIAYPGITWGGSMELVSTHRGSQNFFNELVTEAREKGNPKKISLHRVTLQDALEQGFLAKLQNKLPDGSPILDMDEAAYFDFIKSGCADEESFLQEYMCVPADDNAAFLPYDLIASCEYKGEDALADVTADEDTCPDLPACRVLRKPAATQGGDVYIGVDIGRTIDLTVFCVIEKIADVRFVRELWELRGVPFSRQEDALNALMHRHKVRRLAIDQTGLGRQFAERAQERYGAYRVDAVTFSQATKEAMAYPVKAAFEDKTIRIPNDRQLRADLRGIRKETSPNGNLRFTAERAPNGHADRFWALALALSAAHVSTPPGHIATFQRSPRTLTAGPNRAIA